MVSGKNRIEQYQQLSLAANAEKLHRELQIRTCRTFSTVSTRNQPSGTLPRQLNERPETQHGSRNSNSGFR